ncbi:MAG: 7,8-didemethyl-8-hydroxy-5-deazariboflavin synthase subunit CofH, partial [Deltaproteobacteria bacterium]|nr:7,8-didemethyl-8-hydroxy-5-deazariboflavin synthase subunit CofH [Deltaproteobacteria bacterium]
MSHIEAMFDYEDGAERLYELLPRIETRVARILEDALAGHEVTREEGLILSEVSGGELAALSVTADLMRQAKVGDRVTYVVCRNINFTNVCYVGCKFCAFHTGPNKPGSWDHSLEDVADKAEEAWNRGATEIC